MSVLLGVIVVFALLTLGLAVRQGLTIVRLAPPSAQLGSFMPLGWWKFDKLDAMAGPAAAAHLPIYKRAVIAFLVFLVLGLVLSGWAASRTSSAAATASIEGRLPSTPYALASDLRRAAPQPGPILES